MRAERTRGQLLTAHMIIKNEEQWVWYAITSILPFVFQLFIYDTGSKDKTLGIIKSIHSPRIHVTNVKDVTPEKLIELRNKQIEETKTEWFMLLDGDEVWPKSSILEMINLINNVPSKITAIVSKCIVSVGDLFHALPHTSGKYHLLGHTGHYNIRLYRKRENFSWKGIYPLEAYCDNELTPIQNNDDQLVMAKGVYWHMTHMKRSSVNSHGRYKIERGNRLNDTLPEVLFATRPAVVPSPWVSFSPSEKILSHIRTPLITLKRKIVG